VFSNSCPANSTGSSLGTCPPGGATYHLNGTVRLLASLPARYVLLNADRLLLLLLPNSYHALVFSSFPPVSSSFPSFSAAGAAQALFYSRSQAPRPENSRTPPEQ